MLEICFSEHSLSVLILFLKSGIKLQSRQAVELEFNCVPYTGYLYIRLCATTKQNLVNDYSNQCIYKQSQLQKDLLYFSYPFPSAMAWIMPLLSFHKDSFVEKLVV